MIVNMMRRTQFLLILPLLILAAFEASLFLNAPYPWKLGGCPPGLGVCYPVTYDWSRFGEDVTFYTLLGYWAVIVATGIRQRLLAQSSASIRRTVLSNTFKFALLGSLLMLAMPLWAFPTYPGSSGVTCEVPSPCNTRSEQILAGWNLATTLWGYSTFLTFLVSALGVAEERWHRLLILAQIGLSGAYLAGVEAFFSTGAYTLFGLTQVIIGGIMLILGPLLVLASCLRFSMTHARRLSSFPCLSQS